MVPVCGREWKPFIARASNCSSVRVLSCDTWQLSRQGKQDMKLLSYASLVWPLWLELGTISGSCSLHALALPPF